MRAFPSCWNFAIENHSHQCYYLREIHSGRARSPSLGHVSYIASLMQPDHVSVLYRDHHGWLAGWLRKKLGNSTDAADLAQDTFLRLLANSRVSDLGTEPRAFLTHIAKGLVVDHWRRQAVERAYREALASVPPEHAPSPETRLLILEALMRIDTMLRAMPAQTRDIFLLAQMEALTYAQIAQQLGLALITVKRHMHKAFVACLAAA